MCEPRGHKDMVGALLVEPISKKSGYRYHLHGC